ncbi:MAG: hypothetical protein MJ250_02395 [Alphaproteobacteria bacterium]|nr:hypothetical protein [Alphaproteobacteria bacterium]
MDKTEKSIIEKTNDSEIVELKEEDLSTITAAGSNSFKGKFKSIQKAYA